MPARSDATDLLVAWSNGDQSAFERLVPLVYREMRVLARRYMRHERPGHMLQTTALVNEAYVRLIDWRNIQWQNRAHFVAVSAQLMRRVLVDYARSRLYAKRGGNLHPVSLDEASAVAPLMSDGVAGLLELDIALDRLAAVDPRGAQVIELRYFGGLSVEETAEAMKISPITVIRSWNFAKAWLLRELSGISVS